MFRRKTAFLKPFLLFTFVVAAFFMISHETSAAEAAEKQVRLGVAINQTCLLYTSDAADE